MATDLHPDPSTSNRLRSWSNRQLDKIRRSPSRGHDESRESVFDHLGNAGVVGGAIGAPNLIDPSQQLQEQDVRHGAFVFLQELERVASQPKKESGAQRKGTIDVSSFVAMLTILTTYCLISSNATQKPDMMSTPSPVSMRTLSNHKKTMQV